LLVLALWSTAGAQVSTSGEYRSYPLKYKAPAEVADLLNEMLNGQRMATNVVADAKGKQILLRGPEAAHEIAEKLIGTVDRPPQEEAIGKPVVEPYPCPADRLNETASRLRSLYAERYGLRVAIDTAASQLLVLAPPEIHRLVEKDLGASGNTLRWGSGGPPSSGAAAPGEPTPAKAAEERAAREFVALAHSQAANVEIQLRKFLQGRLEPQAGSGKAPVDYVVFDATGERVELTIDEAHNGISVFGKRSLREQLVRLIRILDRPRQTSGTKVRVLAVRRADPAKVRRAVEAYRTGAGAASETTRRIPLTDKGSRLDRFQGIELVSYLFQDAGQAQPVDEMAPAAGGQPPTTPGEAEAVQRRLQQLGTDVQIETLPDLDVVVLYGRDSDVDQVAKLIEELERLSAETEPVIEIYPLKHVWGESIADIVKQVEQDLVGGRQGRVSITPLGKPDALLLIGWGEAVEAVKELIKKLDKPVEPETQSEIFYLENASAAQVGGTIQQFLSRRGGLSAQVQTTQDMRTNALIVQASPRDMEEVRLMIERLDTNQSPSVNQVKFFKLNNSLANDLATTLESAVNTARGASGGQRSAVLELLDVEGKRLVRSGLLDDVEITPDPRTNVLMVSGPAESMELIGTLIEHLDSPSAVAQIKVFRVVNGDANALAIMLRSLLPSAVGTSLGPQLPGAEGENTLVPVRFSVDIRTNSIIVTGSEGDLNIIEALLLRLDEEDIEQRVTNVYQLKNSPALDVASAINEFLRSERVVQQAAPGTVSPFQQIESEVVVVPEPVRNALIISATPRYIDEIMDLVEGLDQQPAQVMIQVLIAEITLNNTDEFGMELGLQDDVLFDRSLLSELLTTKTTTSEPGLPQVTTETIQGAKNTPGYLFNDPANSLGNSGSDKALEKAALIGTQAISNFATGRVNSELGFGGLILSASSESVSILIRALQESRRLEVLSRPQIMTLDNQQAFIQVGKRVPRVVGSRYDERIMQNTIELEPVGLILGVTPRISPEGTVVMEIDAEKSDLAPEQEGIPISVSGDQVIRSPSINITLAQTTVSASSGETIVLGGLISKSESTVHRRVPYLADIPVLGNMFRFDGEVSKRSELLIILTPRVVRNPEEAEQIKQVEATRMSWCLADVNELHGDTGLYNIRDAKADDGAETIVYPDQSPGGGVPEGPIPTKAPPRAPWPKAFDGRLPEETPLTVPPQTRSEGPLPDLSRRFFNRQSTDNFPPRGYSTAPVSANYAASAVDAAPSAALPATYYDERLYGGATPPAYGQAESIPSQTRYPDSGNWQDYGNLQYRE
jgi:type II secretion system protein D